MTRLAVAVREGKVALAMGAAVVLIDPDAAVMLALRIAKAAKEARQ